MVHTQSNNISKLFSGLSFLAVAGLFGFMASLGLISQATAAPSTSTFTFSPEKIENDWGPDRRFPTGGVESVSAFGRHNVAKIGIDSTEANNSSDTDTRNYYGTEGIKTPKGPAENFEIGKNFGQSVTVDLYLDDSWQGNAVRAGLWTIGDNGNQGTDAVNGSWGILEFAHVDDHKGFRYYSSVNGYQNLDTDFKYGTWVSLKITLNQENNEYDYSINNQIVANSPADEESTFLRNVILNQRNFGQFPQETLSEDSYIAHWSKTRQSPKNINQCKNNGWRTFEFSNQGRCIQYINTGKDSRIES